MIEYAAKIEYLRLWVMIVDSMCMYREVGLDMV